MEDAVDMWPVTPQILKEDFMVGIKDKVVVITGASSGIGAATLGKLNSGSDLP
jgi:hypothetical protein